MFKHVLTALFSVFAALGVFIAANGHSVFARYDGGQGGSMMRHAGSAGGASGANKIDDTSVEEESVRAKAEQNESGQPVRVTRQSDVEKAAEAKRINAMIADRNRTEDPAMAGHNHAAMGNATGVSGGGGGGGGEMGLAGEASSHDKMHASLVDVSTTEPVPDLEISVVRDAHGGWNLTVKPINFRFAPEHVNGKHQHGEGHAHLYVNGTKVSRLYGTDFHIPALRSGENVVRVSLNTNDHQTYALGETPIERVVSITER